jgi:L-ribulose-5-phosphate 3-epimerase
MIPQGEITMKKAIVIRAFSPDPDPLGGAAFLSSLADYERCFAKAAELGFEGVQPYIEPEGFFSLQADDRLLRSIATAAQRAGIVLTSLELRPFSYLFTDDDAAVREAGIKTMRRGMEVAAAMGIPGMLVIPGYVGLPWDPQTKPVRYDLAYDRTRHALGELAPTAEKMGVSLLVENIWNKFLMSPLEARALVDEVGSPRVGWLLDTGNLIAFGYPEQWIRILGRRIKEVHLKDFREAVGNVNGGVGLLQGDVNWPEVIAALNEVGYDGFLTAEMFPYRHYGEAILQHTSVTMDYLLGRKKP